MKRQEQVSWSMNTVSLEINQDPTEIIKQIDNREDNMNAADLDNPQI